jgi:hypothetical protein
MNAPGNNVVILERIHIFPSKLQMLSKGKAMDMNLGSSADDVGLSAELSSSS